MTLWNYADAWEAIADRLPDAPAQIHGDAMWTWRQFDERADGIAAALLAAGCREQETVALYLYNGPEYLEATYGAFKAGLVTANTNYRYTADELAYLWDNADAVAVVFHGTFAPMIEPLRARLPRIHTWLWVDDGSGPCPDWALSYEAAATTFPGRTVAPWGRSGDHLTLMYTGGTTGMPKGVMWRHHDLIGGLELSNGRRPPVGEPSTAFADRLERSGPLNLPCAPLMHGTGFFNAIAVLMIGGAVATLGSRRFDVEELLATIARWRVKSITIVGDAFAKPILQALDAEPDRWDISSLRVVISSGVMWSKETKAGLLRHNDRLILIDALGSSEAIGVASSLTTADSATSADTTDPGGSVAAAAETASFRLGDGGRVIDADGRDVAWGTGEVGMVALRGYLPLGYYKDPDKSAATFRVIDDERYTVPGDHATIDADGTVRLLGRGSQCINTGGEKVFPEEVEEALKRHPSVADVAVVGIPDDRFGETIAAVVQPAPGATLDEAELIAHVKAGLAAYKAPRRFIAVDSLNRAPNGKLDYPALKRLASG